MSDQLARIADQLTELTKVVSSQAVTLGRMEERLGFYNNQLEIHAKKTNDNEIALAAQAKAIDGRLEPIETHVKKVRSVMKAGAWILGLVIPTLVGTILKFAFR